MNPKKIIEAIRDHNLGMQERMYRLLTAIGLLGLATVILCGSLTRENIANIISLTVSFFVLLAITVWAIRTHHIQAGAVITGAIIIYVVLPFNFMTSGGIYGGGAVWMLFGMVYTCLVVRGKVKYVFLVSGCGVFALCYYLAYFYPELIVEHSTEMAYIDSAIALFIVTLLICGMILFQNSIYESENAIAQNQKKEIEELNRAQSSFFSSMSHEIRTPINTIIGLNEMILREEVSDEVAADAKSIQGASKMLLTLINDILDMSKIEAGKMEIVPAVYDVGATLSDIVNMIWVRAKQKNLQFHVEVDPSIPAKLYGDEVRIKQILINLLNNAVKYTSEGSVTLSIQCNREQGDDALITYSIADTGAGIKKESIPYLFSAFKRVDEEKNRYIEGTGLGLSIVKQLVDLMGGEISVNSVYTKGSTFIVTIPQRMISAQTLGRIDIETRYSLNEREHYKQSFEAPKARVLIVDDNETNLMVAEKLLRETKVNIDTVLSGRECLKKTLRIHYDVIFMDHLMPEMDGIECLHAIRSQVGGLNLQTPVVALTANAGSDNQKMYRSEGFEGYLLKPVSGIQLERELLRHLPGELVRMQDENGRNGEIESPVFAKRMKVPVRITTDSVSDIPEKIVAQKGIPIMPYRIKTGGGVFLDGVEAETDGLLEYLRDPDNVVASEAPEVEDYVEFFAEQLTSAQYVIHITMAKEASAGYRNAREAANTFDNVYILNSGHLSSGMGLLVLEASRCVEMGMSAEEIIAKLRKTRDKIHTSFIVDDTKYLMRSGRISSKISAICEALMLHPVIVLRNSNMTVGSILAGTREHVRMRYIKKCFRGVTNIDTKILFITYAGMSRDELKRIEEETKKLVAFENVIYQKASPAISTNCGPGCFGLLYRVQ